MRLDGPKLDWLYLKMVRQIPDTEGKEEEQVVVSSIFQALTLEDFDTTDSEEEDVVKIKRTKE